MKIALTGGVACGKSKIAQQFEKMDAAVIGLDNIARQIVTPGSEVLGLLVGHFGKGILRPDATLNRQELRMILFQNQKNRNIIENIMHPKILEKMQIEIKKIKNKLIIIEIPLLVEKNLAYLFDRVIIVECDEQQQLDRLIKRDNVNKSQAKSMINSQTNQKNRLKIASQLPIDIIKNNLSMLDLEKKVQNLYQKLINL